MVAFETIKEFDVAARRGQDRRRPEKPERLEPEIERGKIRRGGIDEKDVGGGRHSQ